MLLINKIGTIRTESEPEAGIDWCAVSFDFVDVRLHNCANLLSNSNGWFCEEDYLSPAPEVPESDVWQYI